MKMFVRVTVGILLALYAIANLTLLGKGQLWIIAISAAIISVIAVHEIQGVSGCKNKVLTTINMIYAGVIPFYETYKDIIEGKDFFPGFGTLLTVIYIIALMILMLKMYSKTRFEHVVMGLFASMAIPRSILCIIYIYNLLNGYPDLFSTSMVVYIILCTMFSAWLCDSFALFAGMAFGKHKLAPNISPKKTIEGAIGGIVGTTAFSMIAWFICNHFYFHYDTIKWWMPIIFVPLCCIVGICGDLSASVIKRNYGVKDFGTMFPEHGGMMDRVDSFLFAMPFAYVFVRLWVAIL